MKVTIDSGNGYTVYNYLTVDSSPENTGGAIDEYAMDYSYDDARLS